MNRNYRDIYEKEQMNLFRIGEKPDVICTCCNCGTEKSPDI